MHDDERASGAGPEELVDRVPVDRRAFVKAVVVGGFTAPVVATFSTVGITPAYAQGPGSSGQGATTTTPAPATTPAPTTTVAATTTVAPTTTTATTTPAPTTTPGETPATTGTAL